jgi:hypothetical protein
MPGLVPGIHVFLVEAFIDVDGRDKPGHDEKLIVPTGFGSGKGTQLRRSTP